MSLVKIILSLVIALILFFTVAASQAKKNTNSKPNKTKPVQNTMKDDFTVIAEGSDSMVDQPFIFVARDVETYSALQKLIPNLPQKDKSFFDTNNVVAAFSGTKPTGGYSIQFKKGVMIEVKEIKPPKGSMTIQVITTPYKIIAIPKINDETTQQNLELKTDVLWNSKWQNYQVTNGEMTESGGFAGRQKHIPFGGTIKVMRFGDFITLRINFYSRIKDHEGKIKDMASGIVDNEGNIKLTYIDPCSLIQTPRPLLTTEGKFEGNNLLINFDSAQTIVADGYQAKGKLEAVKLKN